MMSGIPTRELKSMHAYIITHTCMHAYANAHKTHTHTHAGAGLGGGDVKWEPQHIRALRSTRVRSLAANYFNSGAIQYTMRVRLCPSYCWRLVLNTIVRKWCCEPLIMC
jgi:hypothetical protein